MRIMIVLLGLFLSSAVTAYENYSPDHPVHVNGYERSNGTYVHDYYRSEPGQAQNDY